MGVLAVVPVLVLPLTVLALVDVVIKVFGISIPLGLWGGVVLALLVIASVAWLVLRVFGRSRRTSILLASGYALAFVVGIPVAYALWKGPGEARPVPTMEAIPAAVDILLIDPPPSLLAIPRRPLPIPAEDIVRWNARYALGTGRPNPFLGDLTLHASGLTREQAHAELGRRRATTGFQSLASSSAPSLGRLSWRREASQAIVLNVDAIHPSEFLPQLRVTGARLPRPEDWESIVSAARGLGPAPVYAILARNLFAVEDDEHARLSAWRTWTQARGGDAAFFQDFGGLALVDAALRVATERSEALGDESLAFQFRPHLFFDTGEDWPNVVDVDELFSSKQVRMCGEPDRPNNCSGYLEAAYQLSNTYGLLTFKDDACTAVRRPTGTGNGQDAMFYRVVESPNDENLVFIDYWWYFPCNPTPTLAGTFLCLPGYNVPGITCHSHRSDWEGVTVVVERRERGVKPRAVIYAQHELGVVYWWPPLVKRWSKDGKAWVPSHPHVFVARDSHASYPSACNRRRGCDQSVDVFGRKEGQHDGAVDWHPYNEGVVCVAARCVRPLPSTREGDEALWNAFDGPWGDFSCILGTLICDLGKAPAAPAAQDRYKRPWQPLTGRRAKTAGFEVRISDYPEPDLSG
jgi:hypothetical protein